MIRNRTATRVLDVGRGGGRFVISFRYLRVGEGPGFCGHIGLQVQESPISPGNSLPLRNIFGAVSTLHAIDELNR